MKRQTIVWLLIISLLINISTIATFSYYRWFRHPGPSMSFHRNGYREEFARRLGLTEEQAAQVNRLRENLWAELKPLGEQLRQQRVEFAELLIQDPIDTLLLQQKIARISEIQQQMQQKSILNLLQHRSLLTPVQWKDFTDMMIKRMHRGETRSGPRPSFRQAPPDSGNPRAPDR
ncbi:MAG: periplasmic heavy metal sensor [candidate division KSB1 bacterium]|nr:periplasmic heavy metal sensor [candidate division KSB1 bacterium]MDZ7317516.1 periplasmic heavy metal sensor [candidate division KSB1 bacterium]